MRIADYIPSFLTCCNLACGFMVFLLEPTWGPILILLGGLFDVFDGAVARLLNATSSIGKELDSLADMVSFGAAPAFLLSTILPHPYQFLSIIPVISVAVRLARFNVQDSDKYYFVGLAVPASALFYVGLYVLIITNALPVPTVLWLVIPSILGISFLNVSKIKMFSFKGINKDKLTKYLFSLCAILGLLSLAISWQYSLLVIMLSYVVFSIYYHIQFEENQD